ncbi:16S rRNA (cytidine(1402)-2'-O)-methyltransferase [Candidatus Gottesmanbacteria bacterium]|nr:16S rRNA (cytidine(1402)-2'-O)-methyltransferase [Candidatus Gottesmanbacteria bacterium]
MGILYIVATPIGNLEDITIRAIRTLFAVDYIACEDTRKTGQLLKTIREKYSSIVRTIGIKVPKLVSYYDEVEIFKTPEIIQLLEENNNVALVSDAGTPLIADPGYKLVSECIKKGIQVVPILGPTSFVAALVSSGLPTNQILFLGYLPPKPVKRRAILTDLHRYIDTSKYFKPTILFFETPHRLHDSLSDIKEVFGDIDIVIARELTKVYEEIWRGKISEALNKNFKGELTVLFPSHPDV